MTNHLTDSELILALDGELGAVESEAVRAHLAACAACRERSAEFEAVSARIFGLHLERRPRVRRRAWWIPAAVAAAVALIWLAIPRQHPQQPPAHAAVFAAGPQLVAPAEVKRSPQPVARVAKRAVRPVEQVSPFVALPFSNDALPLDDAPIVRVELPVDSLRLASSLNVEGNVVGGRVTADVVLGLDGQPRAIRFVR